MPRLWNSRCWYFPFRKSTNKTAKPTTKIGVKDLLLPRDRPAFTLQKTYYCEVKDLLLPSKLRIESWELRVLPVRTPTFDPQSRIDCKFQSKLSNLNFNSSYKTFSSKSFHKMSFLWFSWIMDLLSFSPTYTYTLVKAFVYKGLRLGICLGTCTKHLPNIYLNIYLIIICKLHSSPSFSISL